MLVKLEWLKVLKNSTRNCARHRSVIGMFLNTPMSQLNRPGPFRGSFADVADGSGGRLGEGGGIKPVHARRALAGDTAVWVSADVNGTIRIQAGLRNVLSGENRERESRFLGDNSGKLPIAEHTLHESVAVCGAGMSHRYERTKTCVRLKSEVPKSSCLLPEAYHGIGRGPAPPVAPAPVEPLDAGTVSSECCQV